MLDKNWSKLGKSIGTLTKCFKGYNNKQNFPVRENNIFE